MITNHHMRMATTMIYYKTGFMPLIIRDESLNLTRKKEKNVLIYSFEVVEKEP